MPFVQIHYIKSVEEFLTDEVLDKVIVGITDILPGNLDPFDDIDLDLAVRHPKARSKYEITIAIEAVITNERAQLLEEDLTAAIQRRIEAALSYMLTVNVWLKLVNAGYASS